MVRPQPAAAVLRMTGTTAREMAEAIGYSETWISLVLRGHSQPGARFRAKVAEYLDRPESELFRDDDAPRLGAA
jgi:transcriptional regulator with XRE-family HTH domain